MDPKYTTIILGIIVLLFGIYNLYIRIKKPEVYQISLDAVKRTFGNGFGTFLHIMSRVILPIIVGIITIILGVLGESIM